MKSHSILFVNPVQRESAQGRHLQRYVVIDPNTGEVKSTQSMNKPADDTISATYSFPINVEKNRLETGLDELITNPFKGDSIENLRAKYGLSKEWVDILTRTVELNTISKQVYYEILSGVEPDTYTSEIKSGNVFSQGFGRAKWDEKKSFLETFKIILYPRPNRFTSETPRGRLSMELIKIHSKIANNRDLVNNAVHAFFISEENEDEIRMNKKRELVEKATYNLYKLKSEDTAYRRYQTAILLKDSRGSNLVKGNINDEKVKTTLSRYLSDSNPKQMFNIDYFLDKVNLLKTPEGIEKFEVEYLVQQAMNTNVMTALDGYIIWHSKIDKKNVSKFTDVDKLIEFISSEADKYEEKSKAVNYYSELIDELKLKDVWIEN